MFKLWSNSFKDGDEMPKAQRFNGMGQDGDNLSPSLFWENPPQGTKSFVITMYDPDAPTGSGWWHWVVANIPAETTQLEEGASTKGLPKGAVQVRNDFSFYEYGGAAPPPGVTHKYIFTIYAMDVEALDITRDVSPAYVGFNTHFHALGSAQISCVFGSK